MLAALLSPLQAEAASVRASAQRLSAVTRFGDPPTGGVRAAAGERSGGKSARVPRVLLGDVRRLRFTPALDWETDVNGSLL